MTRLWLVLSLALAALVLAPPAHTKPKPSSPALTEQQELVVKVALARTLPASLSTGQRALLTATKKALAAGQTAKASASYKKFLAAAGSAKLTAAQLDIVERWLAREAVLSGHKELDALAYKLGKSEQAITALGAHRVELAAIGAKPPTTKGKWSIEIVALESGEVVKKGKRSVTRSELGDAIRELDAKSEDIKTQRDEIKTKFQAVDQKANQTMNLLVQILKTMNELRLSGTKSGL